VEICSLFGPLERSLDDSKTAYQVQGEPGVMRIGNVRDASNSGALVSMLATAPPLPADGNPQWRRTAHGDPTSKKKTTKHRPLGWHTDSVYRESPPVGSALFCAQRPAGGGGATCFASTAIGLADLPAPTRDRLASLECLASLAHHDAKVRKSGSPDYPLLPAALRKANPPRRVPCVLAHPVTGTSAFYGVNSGTFACVPAKDAEAFLRACDLDAYELDGVEHASVDAELRALLPHFTAPKYTLVWDWQPGDLVVWDNRCTMHCATGFDAARDVREMWRVTITDDHPDSLTSMGLRQ